jgi:gas vesicle protein
MTERIDSAAGYFLAGLVIGSLVSIFFAPKSGEGTRQYLSKKVKEGSEHARRKAQELSEHADDWVERGKELVNRKKEEIATKLEDAGETYLPEKSKAKGV